MDSAFAPQEVTPILEGPADAERSLVERYRRARKDNGLAVLEGLHALKHALRFEGTIETAHTDDREALLRLATDLAPDVISRLDRMVHQVPTSVFSMLAPKAPETGVIALARRPAIDPGSPFITQARAPSIWLEDPSHLGNVGAVVRVAAAAGASAVMISGRHDPWDPAALRGSAGLHFALPVFFQNAPPSDQGPLIAIDPEGDPLRPEALPKNAVLAFGSERRGLSTDTIKRADRRLALPMQDKVSSLNLATAVAAVLYAWRFSER